LQFDDEDFLEEEQDSSVLVEQQQQQQQQHVSSSNGSSRVVSVDANQHMSLGDFLDNCNVNTQRRLAEQIQQYSRHNDFHSSDEEEETNVQYLLPPKEYNNEIHEQAIAHNQNNCTILNLPVEVTFLIFHYIELDVVFLDLRLVCQDWKNLVEKEVSNYDLIERLRLEKELFYLTPRIIEKFVVPNCKSLDILDLANWQNPLLSAKNRAKYIHRWEAEFFSELSSSDSEGDEADESDFAPSDVGYYGIEEHEKDNEYDGDSTVTDSNLYLREGNVIKLLKNSPNLKQFYVSHLTLPIVKTLIENNPLLENVSLHHIKYPDSIELILKSMKNLKRVHFLNVTRNNVNQCKKNLATHQNLLDVSMLVYDAIMPPNELAHCLQASQHQLKSLFLFDYLSAEAQMRIESIDPSRSIFEYVIAEMNIKLLPDYMREHTNIYTFPKLEAAFFGAYPVKGGLDRFYFPKLRRLLILSVVSSNMKQLGEWLLKHNIEEFVLAAISLRAHDFKYLVPAIRKMKKFCMMIGNETADAPEIINELFREGGQEMRHDFELYLKINDDTLDNGNDILRVCGSHLQGLEIRPEIQAYFSKKIVLENLIHDDNEHLTNAFFKKTLVMSNVDFESDPKNFFQYLRVSGIKTIELLFCTLSTVGEFFQFLPLLSVEKMHIAFTESALESFQVVVSDIVANQLLQSTKPQKENDHQDSDNGIYVDLDDVSDDILQELMENNVTLSMNPAMKWKGLSAIKTLKITAPLEQTYFLTLLAFIMPEVTNLILADMDDSFSSYARHHARMTKEFLDIRNKVMDVTAKKYAPILDSLTQFKKLERLTLDVKTLEPAKLVELVAQRTRRKKTNFAKLKYVEVFCFDPFLTFTRRDIAKIRSINPSLEFTVFDTPRDV
jgi:hypothetical protein